MPVVEIKTEDEFTSLISNSKDKLVILYFHAPWAAPCIQMTTVFETLSKAHPEFDFVSVNADELASISELFEISLVPHFVFLKNEVNLKEISGADPKEIATAIEEFKLTKAQVPKQELEPKQVAQPSEEEVNKRLEQLTKAAPIMVFIKGTPAEPKCGFSRQLVAILREHQTKFGFFDILKDDSVRQGLKTFSDWPTFPQLYINGEFQGGLDIIKENLEEDSDFFNTALNS